MALVCVGPRLLCCICPVHVLEALGGAGSESGTPFCGAVCAAPLEASCPRCGRAAHIEWHTRVSVLPVISGSASMCRLQLTYCCMQTEYSVTSGSCPWLCSACSGVVPASWSPGGPRLSPWYVTSAESCLGTRVLGGPAGVTPHHTCSLFIIIIIIL